MVGGLVVVGGLYNYLGQDVFVQLRDGIQTIHHHDLSRIWYKSFHNISPLLCRKKKRTHKCVQLICQTLSKISSKWGWISIDFSYKKKTHTLVMKRSLALLLTIQLLSYSYPVVMSNLIGWLGRKTKRNNKRKSLQLMNIDYSSQVYDKKVKEEDDK